MEKIIYSRFSNERAPEFNICTQIIEAGDGSKRIRKKAYQKEGAEHIHNIYKAYLQFEKMYQNSIFKANKCKETEQGLEFEFLDGKNLENILDEYIGQKEYEKAKELIVQYVKELRKIHTDGTFQRTAEFERVFGEVKLPEELDASSYTDIDLIFQNIIVTGDKWNIIDYEWTFDFPIPLNYVIYRALFYFYYETPERRVVVNEQLFQKFGIDEKEIQCYQLMEQNFQKYIQKDYVPLRDREDIPIEKKAAFDSWKEEVNNRQLYSDVQLYLDYGQGYSEENSRRFSRQLDAQNVFYLKAELEAGVCNLRIDPFMRRCAIRIEELSGEDTQWYPLEYTTNGIEVAEKIIAFKTDDPQIMVSNLHKDTGRIWMKIKYFPYDERAVEDYFKTAEEKVRYQQEIVNLQEQKKQEIENLIEQAKKEKTKLKEQVKRESKKLKEQAEKEKKTAEGQIEALQKEILELQIEKTEYLRVLAAKEKVILDKEAQLEKTIGAKMRKLKHKVMRKDRA